MIKPKNYAVRFAFLFSMATALIFSFFLYEYASLVRATEEAKSEAELYTQARRIVAEMDRFDSQKESYFYFPRYKMYKSALYSSSKKIIFSNLDFEPTLTPGYGKKGGKRYFVYELPPFIYFGADYLVVSKDFYESELYFKLLSFLLVALVLSFGVYLHLIRLFEKPLRQLNESLDRFIKDAIHEINTPLSIITTNIELFSMKYGENKHLSRIKAAAKSLSNLYSDMEYLIKAEKGEFGREKINLTDAVEERIEYFTEIAQMKGIEFASELEGDCYIYTNRVKLNRLIDNNLSNAIKYSNENSKIEVSLKKTEHMAILIFKDYGIGIEKPEKIFDRYYREEISKGGFGLGLNIVKNICDDDDIEVSVKSVVNKGSSFKYVFKLLG
ncbi:MAG: HAMP domain-containing sensor histidine kinase [Campylobacterales bacterium]|nr:HAMP domain-containing sensor histidine kinase [Campylobacterales bacterium]